jgi:histidine triad (HIT) family protein
MDECIFCKIVNGETPSFKVYEDEDCVAFLDVMPRSKGMCLVVPKKHYVFFDEDMDTSSKAFNAALIVGRKIKEALDPLTIFFSVIQAQVPHFHIRVYPVYKDQIPLGENKPIEVNETELKELHEKIKSVEVDWKPKEKIVEIIKEIPAEKEEPKTEEETEKEDKESKFWRKRNWEVG